MNIPFLFFALFLGFITGLLCLWLIFWIQERKKQPQNDAFAQILERLLGIEKIREVMPEFFTNFTSLREKLEHLEKVQTIIGQGVGKFGETISKTEGELKEKLNAAFNTQNKGQIENTEKLSTLLNNSLKEVGSIKQQLQESVVPKSKDILENVESIRKVMIGSKTKGKAGENFFESYFSFLPVPWQVKNFKVQGGVVEFGLRLHTRLVVPIDCKWPDNKIIQKLNEKEGEEDEEGGWDIDKEIQTNVEKMAKGIKKYIDPHLTTDFGIIALPDGIFRHSYSLSAKLYEDKILLLSFSAAVPFLVFLRQFFENYSQSINIEKLQNSLAQLEQITKEIAEMLINELPKRLSKVQDSIHQLTSYNSKLQAVQNNLKSFSAMETNNPPKKVENPVVFQPEPILHKEI